MDKQTPQMKHWYAEDMEIAKHIKQTQGSFAAATFLKKMEYSLATARVIICGKSENR